MSLTTKSSLFLSFSFFFSFFLGATPWTKKGPRLRGSIVSRKNRASTTEGELSIWKTLGKEGAKLFLLKRAETLWGKVSNGLWTRLRTSLPSFLKESFALSYTLPSKHFLKFLFLSLSKKKRKKRDTWSSRFELLWSRKGILSKQNSDSEFGQWNETVNEISRRFIDG